jgi:RNA polymerase sigma-70 factor (ECF subfamily)
VSGQPAEGLEFSSPERDPARDAELVARAQRGDAAAFDALISPLLPRALQLARRLLGDLQDAEDLVQDACLRALDRIEQHDRERPFAPWFMRVLANLGINQQKSRQLRSHQPLTEYTPASGDLPDALAERSEIQERFATAVAELSDRQREIVMLHEVEGWSTADIGSALELTQATVRWHLHDARHTLRAALHMLRDDATSKTSEER